MAKFEKKAKVEKESVLEVLAENNAEIIVEVPVEEKVEPSVEVVEQPAKVEKAKATKPQTLANFLF